MSTGVEKSSIVTRNMVYEKLGYVPSKEQAEMHYADLYDTDLKEKWVSGGEQSGKSFSAAKELGGRIFEGTIFWICGSDYENCDREFDYLLADLVQVLEADRLDLDTAH